MRGRRLAIVVLLLGVLLTLVGCGGHGSTPPEPEPNVILRFLWPSDRGPTREIPAGTETIEVTVLESSSGPVIATASVDKSQIVGGVAEVSLFVPPGPARVFSVLAKDASGNAIGEGTATVDIARAATTQVNIVLTPFSPQLAVSPSTLDFRATLTQLRLTISNVGNLPLNWTLTAPSVTWLSAASPQSGQVLPADSTLVTVEVSRVGTSPGTHTADISIASDGGDATVTCVITVIEHPWPMFHQNPLHTAVSPFIGAQAAVQKWTFTMPAAVYCSPVVAADGSVYVGCEDSKLYSLSPDGTQRWEFLANGPIEACPALAPDGTIYVSCQSSDTLMAIAPDGSEKWSVDFVSGGSAPVVGPDGTVYVGSTDDNLYAINPDGTEQWVYYCEGHRVDTSPALAPDGTLYVAFGSYVCAVNPDGTERWTHATASAITGSPALGPDGTLYAACDGALIAINPDGTEKWTAMTGGSTASAGVASDGAIIVGAGTALIAYRPNGTVKWSRDFSDAVRSSPAIGADGTIYIGCDDGSLYAFDPRGTQKFAFPTGGAVRSSPAIGTDGTVYFGSTDGRLYAIAAPLGPSGDIPVVIQ
jgi:outer membrane protein assembly factor BamB